MAHPAEHPTVVVALGGHAFISPGERGTYADHLKNAASIADQLMILIERGYNLVITHGNGPQVGDLLDAAELTRDRVPPLPLDALVAQTEGSLGYLLQQALLNALLRRGIRRYVVTMVTQVLVDAADPAFGKPTKPVGPAMSREAAEARRDADGWTIAHDVARGWRRVVPSPIPKKVLQHDMIRSTSRQGHIVIAGGGGGIPYAETPDGYVGIEAVIDKDLTSSILATEVGADLLVILTAVDRVYLGFGGPNPEPLGAVTIAECREYIAGGHFPAGSMGPKVAAIHGFLQRGGRRGLITSPDRLADAIDGAAGTHFVGRI
jgi:carbamate kinase